MAREINFYVAGTPKSMAIVGVARFRKGGVMHTVPKRKGTEWGTLIGVVAQQHAPPEPWTGPVVLELHFDVPRPMSAKKSVTQPLKRPDLDNLVHKLTDQFNGVFWLDDAQIVMLTATKSFGENGRTGLRVVVREHVEYALMLT